MSYRSEPENLKERVAALEAQLRRTTSIAVTGSGAGGSGPRGPAGERGPAGPAGPAGSSAASDDMTILEWLGGPT